MTLAFIISAVIAGILFFLWISLKDKLEMAETQIKHLNDSLQEKLKHDTSRDEFRLQTVLKQDMIDDLVAGHSIITINGWKRRPAEMYGKTKRNQNININ